MGNEGSQLSERVTTRSRQLISPLFCQFIRIYTGRAADTLPPPWPLHHPPSPWTRNQRFTKGVVLVGQDRRASARERENKASSRQAREREREGRESRILEDGPTKGNRRLSLLRAYVGSSFEVFGRFFSEQETVCK